MNKDFTCHPSSESEEEISALYAMICNLEDSFRSYRLESQREIDRLNNLLKLHTQQGPQCSAVQ